MDAVRDHPFILSLADEERDPKWIPQWKKSKHFPKTIKLCIGNLTTGTLDIKKHAKNYLRRILRNLLRVIQTL